MIYLKYRIPGIVTAKNLAVINLTAHEEYSHQFADNINYWNPAAVIDTFSEFAVHKFSKKYDLLLVLGPHYFEYSFRVLKLLVSTAFGGKLPEIVYLYNTKTFRVYKIQRRKRVKNLLAFSLRFGLKKLLGLVFHLKRIKKDPVR
jgi:hypothetical protein